MNNIDRLIEYVKEKADQSIVNHTSFFPMDEIERWIREFLGNGSKGE